MRAWRLVAFASLVACGSSSSGGASSPPPDDSTAQSPWFREVAAASGVTHARDASQYATLQGRMSGGVCVLDADGDGQRDLFFPGPHEGHLDIAHGAWSYVDEASSRGLSDPGDASGCIAFDVEGDGDVDLVVTAFGGARLFSNDGSGHFSDDSAKLGSAFGANDVTSSAAAFDADGDGDLDLAVAVYGRFVDPGANGKCFGPCASDITQYDYGSTKLLFQQDDGAFTDESARLGAPLKEPGLVVLATDLDADGAIDLFVGNDISKFPDRYFKNDGKGSFTEIGKALGVAFASNESGLYSMSATDGDLDGDGLLDLAESSWDDERDGIFTCVASGCSDVGDALGFSLTSTAPRNFRWGQALADFDDDGAIELFEARGHYQIDSDSDVSTFPTSDVASLWRKNGATFAIESLVTETPAKTAGRGAIASDLDGDGDLDVVVGSALGAPLLLENVREGRGHWIEVRLVGKGKNARGVGAHVAVRANGRKFQAIVHAGASFMSSDDGAVHVGLGALDHVDAIDVAWPDGATSHVTTVTIDGVNVVRE